MCKSTKGTKKVSAYKQYLKDNIVKCKKCDGFGYLDPDVFNLSEWTPCDECKGDSYFNKEANRTATKQEIFLYHAPEPKCIGCRATPEKLSEYKVLAGMEGITATEFMLENEGTYDMFEPNKFYCTKCYIEAGQPRIPQCQR